MSGNTSATGGYLTPSNEPADGDDLDNILMDAIVGITALDPTLVRPRWQAQPPTQPDPATDWCAFGVTLREPVDYPYESLDSTGTTYTMQRHERLEGMATFYGPNANRYARRLRDGLYINQNLEALATQGIKLYEAGQMSIVPEEINGQYIHRVDLTVVFMRQVNINYPILSILSVEVDTSSDDGNSDNRTIP